MPDTVRYGIGDLADLASVSRRTVRYYVQEGLLPPPLGVGRGNHYAPEHLEQLIRVKAMQEAGRTLDEIKRIVAPGARGALSRSAPASHDQAQPVERALWRRLTLAPGIELHVAGNVRLPPPGKLHALAAWCRTHFSVSAKDEDADA